MGFHLEHIGKYVRWQKSDRAAYRDTSLVSRDLAKINRRLNYATLLGRTNEVEAISDEKHR